MVSWRLPNMPLAGKDHPQQKKPAKMGRGRESRAVWRPACGWTSEPLGDATEEQGQGRQRQRQGLGRQRLSGIIRLIGHFTAVAECYQFSFLSQCSLQSADTLSECRVLKCARALPIAPCCLRQRLLEYNFMFQLWWSRVDNPVHRLL